MTRKLNPLVGIELDFNKFASPINVRCGDLATQDATGGYLRSHDRELFTVSIVSNPAEKSRIDAQAIRDIIAQHGRLPGGGADLTDETDLYGAGLTSLATVGVMLALEERFNIEFPESKLNRSTFRSVAAIASLIAELAS
jgi:acyl carrier protein